VLTCHVQKNAHMPRAKERSRKKASTPHFWLTICIGSKGVEWAPTGVARLHLALESVCWFKCTEMLECCSCSFTLLVIDWTVSLRQKKPPLAWRTKQTTCYRQRSVWMQLLCFGLYSLTCVTGCWVESWMKCKCSVPPTWWDCLFVWGPESQDILLET